MFRLILGLIGLVFLASVNPVRAADVPLGFHLLDPHELSLALPYRQSENSPLYLTIPWSIYDRRRDIWEDFFKKAHASNAVPIVRWITKFENGNWQIPSRKDVVEATKFLSSLNWPGRRIVVLFNEPNHASEWGGRLDPAGYAELALFAASWLKTEKPDYEVLSAGLDNDAPNNGTMMDSFVFIDRMYGTSPELFEIIDGWTSHSYPNPAFSGSVYGRGKNSIRGFEAELSKLKQLTGRSFDVFITETGWKYNSLIASRLRGYYKEAVTKVWTDERIKAVTLFVLRGSNGPFEGFSFLDGDDQPTAQMRALQLVLDGK